MNRDNMPTNNDQSTTAKMFGILGSTLYLAASVAQRVMAAQPATPSASASASMPTPSASMPTPSASTKAEEKKTLLTKNPQTQKATAQPPQQTMNSDSSSNGPCGGCCNGCAECCVVSLTCCCR